MLQRVDVGERSIRSYRGVAAPSLLDELVRCAEGLRGARVLHVNATPYGGGVSELLRSVVPLLNDLGLIADWQVITGDDRFFDVTKRMHNALQGAEASLSKADRETYVAAGELNATLLGGQEYDFVFVHDPQPATLLSLHGRGSGRWIWRCHIDTSAPNPEVWQFVRGFLSGYDAAIFSMPEFLPPDIPIDRVEIIAPAIDPLSPKNMLVPEAIAQHLLDWIGIDTGMPLVTQISRFDPWKDPLGVIAAYRLARQEVPELQLALAGSMALDDPEGWELYREITSASTDDPLIHVFTNLTGVGNAEVNAFQRLSDVVIQKSLREGFGLVVSEALWKSTPVVAGRAGGIPLQMADGVGGALVDSVEDCAAAVVHLLRDRDRARQLGAAGHDRVRDYFLLPRMLLNELYLMRELAAKRPLERPAPAADGMRDLVCGMAIDPQQEALELNYDGRTFRFCSESCRLRFRARPETFSAVATPALRGPRRSERDDDSTPTS